MDQPLSLINEISTHSGEPFKVQMFPKIMACVRSGDVEELIVQLNSEAYRSYFAQVIHIIWSVPTSFGSCVTVAWEGGLSPDHAGAICSRYMRKFYSILTPEEQFDCMCEGILELTQAVRTAKEFETRSAVMRCCMEYIHFHVYEKINLDVLAAECGYSLSRMQYFCRAETGLSLRQLIMKLKLDKAKFYLKYTNESCLAISQKLSFCSQSNFIKHFKEETGMTPSAYRADPQHT